MRSSRNVVRIALACIAIGAIASVANAAVFAGVVDGGIHMQYGPQDTGGNYMGIASESYDFYVDALWGNTGWGDNFPTWSGDQRPPDGVGFGYVLLAFNPYTGVVWSDIPTEHQALDPASSYTGHAPTVSKTGPSGLPDDPGTPDVDESIVQSEVVQYAATPFDADCVYITGAFLPRPDDGIFLEAFGSFVQTSSDGGILSTTGWPVYAGGPALLQTGEEVRTYSAGDPDRPDCFDPGDTGDLTFEQTKGWGYTGFWEWSWGYYAGSNGGVADTIVGFEMDGRQGWMRLDFAADRTGVRLTEYYFDGQLGDYDGDQDVDADDVDILCANIGETDPDLLAKMDLDDDGDIDMDDQVIHITTLLDYDLDGDDVVDGQGTFVADFNTDGAVDLADLTILRTNSGLTGQGFADGDTNCDGAVDLADLTTLRGLSGSSVAGVPEPALVSLLLVGGGALLAKRRRLTA